MELWTVVDSNAEWWSSDHNNKQSDIQVKDYPSNFHPYVIKPNADTQ